MHQNPLLATRLYIPPFRSKLVSRPCLVDQLNSGLDRRLTLVSAPAGFGKTTLIADWTHDSRLTIPDPGSDSRKEIAHESQERPIASRLAWLSLDEGDNDLNWFLTYFVAALQTIDHDLGQGVLSALQSAGIINAESVLTTLINDMAGFPDRIVLVLDDYHAIESLAVDNALTFLLDHLPPPPGGVHLVIASRIEPSLPLARMQLGFNKPRHTIHGSELAGEIESVGKEVKSYQPGDQVFGFSEGFGAYSEYVCMPEDGVLAPKPVNLTYEEAAVVPHGAMTALHFMRDQAKIEPGQRVLINGASGGIGQYAVQLAKSYGAQVTGVCSTLKLESVGSLGADEVIDYTQTDFAQNGETYDVIFDTARVTGFSECKGSLTENGRYLLAVFKMRELLQMLWTSMVGSKKVVCAMAPTKQESLLVVRDHRGGKAKAHHR